MMATEILSEEHTSIKMMLSILEQICKQIESTGTANAEHLGKAVRFIQGYADTYHHHKEEDLLFKEMEIAGMSSETGPLAVMLSDHTQGRNYVKGMKRALEEIREGRKTALTQFTENARGYAELLEAHIFKEDNILYNMANAHMSEAQQEKLLREFEKVQPTENFLKILEELKAEYL